MTLIQETLFGTVDKVSIAIARLREFEPAEGYYLAFSGGKDSCVILDLAKRAGVKYDAHYNLTTVDPPETCYNKTRPPTVTTGGVTHEKTGPHTDRIQEHPRPPAPAARRRGDRPH